MASQIPLKTPPFTEIEEYDQANNLIATYVQSPSNSGSRETRSRIDVIIPQNTHSYARSILNAFLPAGYPHSVTSDYLEYQIYDSLQAFSSSIASLLSSRAVLAGLGVGDASASPTSALLLSVLQDSVGRIATILFAHRLGTALEPECKMFRLMADVFNDAAMVLDCLSPVFPTGVRVGVLAGSSVLRSLCGVAAGSAKASLSAHFAREGNLGELNAKDSSQETVISLFGMLCGTLLISYIPSDSLLATWITLFILLSIHLGTNYLAVRAVCMRTLNRQRANLVFGEAFGEAGLTRVKGRIEAKGLNEGEEWNFPSLDWVRQRERVFERDGVLKCEGIVVGYCEVGVSFQKLLECHSSSLLPSTLTQTLALFAKKPYIIACKARQKQYFIALKEEASSRDIIEAWMVVCLAATFEHLVGKEEERRDLLEHCLECVDEWRELAWRGFEKERWDLSVGALETRGRIRIRVKE